MCHRLLYVNAAITTRQVARLVSMLTVTCWCSPDPFARSPIGVMWCDYVMGGLDGCTELLDNLVDLGARRHVNVLVTSNLNNHTTDDFRVNLSAVEDGG